MLGIGFEQGKLLVGAGTDVRAERAVVLSKLGSGAVFRALLKRLNVTVSLVVQSAENRLIETPCGKIRLNAGIDGLGEILVEP